MSLSLQAERVLAAILSFGSGEDSFPLGGIQCQTLGSDELFAFCELLGSEPPEEALQKFLVINPGFLMGLFGTRDGGDLALISKPRIGTKFIADFALLQVFQGGATIFLIEIETSHEPIFTRALSPARRLQLALTQIDEWREWIEPNKLYFVRSTIDDACDLLEYKSKEPSTNGYRFTSEDQIRGLWGLFRGFEHPNIKYAVIIGRWSHLTRDGKERFITKFQNFPNCSILTYEQLARQALQRLDRQEI